jgi:hypothetical protein
MSAVFDRALVDDPPVQYGTYQYIRPGGEATTSEYRLQFAETPPDNAPPGSAGTDSTPFWGHTPVQPVQYPLQDEPPSETIPPAATDTLQAPAWVPPVLAPPTSPGDEAQSGWVTFTDPRLDATHVVGTGNSLGITTLEGRGVVEFPRWRGFSLRPRFGGHVLSGPHSTDLPGQLYDVSVEAKIFRPFGELWLTEIAIAPSLFTDFRNVSGDAVRIVGRGLAYYTWSPQLKLAVGVAYLDRDDIQVLPVGGLLWTPTPDDRCEIMLPRPRFAHRFRQDDRHERWVYVAGEFGGGTWAIERASGAADVATYRDFRLVTGIEFMFGDETSWRFEGGYVFGRELEYDSGIGGLEPRDTAMLRGSFTF